MCIQHLCRPIPWTVMGFLALALSGCGPKEAALPGGKAPEEKTLQVTVWTDRFEVFLEHRPIIAGAPATFGAHVTDVRTLGPRREGPVTFVLRHGSSDPVRQTAPAPAKPGIYMPELTFTSPGEWEVTMLVPEGGAESRVGLGKFDVHPSREAALKNERPSEPPQGISFLKEEQWKVLTGTEPVKRSRVVERRRLPDAARSLEASFQGVTVSRVLEGRNSFDLVLRMSENGGWDPESIGDLPLDGPGRGKLPLKAVAGVVKDIGPNTISREDVERKIVVMCNVAGRDVASVVGDTRRLIDPIVSRERGYRVEYGGQFEAAEEANRTLGYLGAAVVLAIGFLLHLAFGTGRDAALVMVNLPLALIGGVAGVFVSGGVLSVASLIGFITVFGIATRNGIMLVSHIRHLQVEEGITDFREAVFRGAVERVAPILMTALAAGLALIPLALGGGKPGSEIQTPMAIVILFGLLTSMLLNMIVVPTLYLRWGRPAMNAGGAR